MALDPIEEGALGHLRRKIRIRLNDLADLLANGEAKDYSQYQYIVGTIAGLAQAERELLDIIQTQGEA